MDFTGLVINNQYALINKITDGMTSSLYLTERIDKKTEPIAVKIFRDDIITKKTDDIIRFKHEIKTVSTLEHPHIIRIYDTGEIFKLHYIVMEYIRGENISKILANTSLSTELVVEIIVQTCEALDCLHQNGIVHGELKPGHVIINEKYATEGLMIKLSDCGVARIKNFNALMMQSENISGLFQYLSPEQFALKKIQSDKRSDLYSLGVIFYHLLTGRLPFSKVDPFSPLHQYTLQPNEFPSVYNPSIPSVIDRIVVKLLDKEPENRYQSARGLLSDLERYKSGDLEFSPGLNDTLIKLSYRTRLVGRHKELTRLKGIYHQTMNGLGGLCLIRGEAGGGKTRLIEELGEYIRSDNTIFIHVKCFSGENKEPYRQLKDALNEYLKIFSSYPDVKKKEIRDNLSASVGVLGETIIKLNPLMNEILEKCPSMVPLEPERENQRFLAVASQFFVNLSHVESGFVLAIDDLQWCDDGTFELLARIADGASKSPLLIVGAYRHDEIPESCGLRRFNNDVEKKGNLLAAITIEHLDGSAMNMFVSGLLYDKETNVRETSEFIHLKSKGNPFFAIEILKQLVNEKAVYYDKNKWNIDHTILSRAVIPDTIIEILIKRISFLDRNEAEVLSYAAVAGRSFEFELLFRLLNRFSKNELAGIIDKCIQVQLIEKYMQADGKLSFVHDRIQEAFYANIDHDMLKGMHAKIAKTLEDIYSDNKDEVLFKLTHHYIESGDKNKSLEYAYPASFKASENFANEDALRYFNIAVDLLEEKIACGDDAVRPLWMKSKEGMAQVYLRIGRYDDAIAIFNEILCYEDPDGNRALVLRDISSAYRKKGDWANSEKYAKLGMEMLGGWLPVTRGLVIASLIKEVFVHFLLLILPGSFVAKRPSAKAEKKIEQRFFYESLIYTYILSERVKYVRAVIKLLNLIERYRIGGQPLAKALNVYGTLLMAFTRFNDALRCYHKALAIASEINDHHCIGRSYQLIGVCHEWQGEYDKAIENYNKAIDIYSMIGDTNEIGLTLNGLSNIYFILAEFDKLKMTNKKFLEIAHKSMDNYQICNALVLVAFYYQGIGKIDLAKQVAIKTYDLSYEYKIWMPHCIINIVLGQLCKDTNEIEKSIEYFERAKELYKKHGFLKHYTIHLYPCMADAYVEYLSKIKLIDEQRVFYIGKIDRICKVALRKTKRWTAHYHKSLLANAKYYAVINNNKKAKYYFIQSIDHCSKRKMKFEMAKSLYEYGLFLSKTGDEESSRKSLETAYQIFSDIGSCLYSDKLQKLLGIDGKTEDPTSIQKHIYLKQLSTLDRICSEISQISDPQQLFDAVLQNALAITFAQKGYLFIANDDNELEHKSSASLVKSDENTFFTRVIENVFLSGRPIITAGDVEVAKCRGPDVRTACPQSILTAPIKTTEKIIGVCYLEKYRANEVFTDDDVDLITAYISKIAASMNYMLLYNKLKFPNNDNKPTITSIYEEKIKKVMAYIKENYRRDISREGLASLIDSNPDYFGRCFKQYTGYKINNYINVIRVEEAARKLRETGEKIIDIAFSVGFENLSTFNKTFYKIMKTIPSNYRKKA